MYTFLYDYRNILHVHVCVKSTHVLHVYMCIEYMYYCFSALFLSALKSQGIPYSPAGIKRAIEGSATPLGSHLPFSVGRGVIQVQYTLYKLCNWT